MIKDVIKRIIKLSPIPLTKNHRYDLLTNKIIKQLAVNSNCIDVGCYKGEILDLIKSAAPQGQHFGIEPIPAQYAYLSQKYADVANCTIINIAASNTTGTSDFNFVQSNPSYSGLKKRDYDKPNEVDSTIQVKTDLLDHVIPSDIPIALIKIDVEGAEMLVLEGATKIIKRHRPIVVFEHGLGASEHYGATPEGVHDFFSQMDMKVSSLSKFISRGTSFSKAAFAKQYHERINHYFVAHR